MIMYNETLTVLTNKNFINYEKENLYAFGSYVADWRECNGAEWQ